MKEETLKKREWKIDKRERNLRKRKKELDDKEARLNEWQDDLYGWEEQLDIEWERDLHEWKKNSYEWKGDFHERLARGRRRGLGQADPDRWSDRQYDELERKLDVISKELDERDILGFIRVAGKCMRKIL